MAAKEEVVARLDGHSIAHEDGTVARKSEGHTAGNNLRVLRHVCDRRNWDTEVTRRTPEVGRAEVIEVLIRPYLRIERFHCGGHGEGCVLGGESEN